MSMDVMDIVAEYLEKNKFDGLMECDRECACKLSDLAPCSEGMASCIPGYLAPCKCGGGHDFHIQSCKE